ncbi:MFS toxin efflux pump [Aspergillus sclerotialis]|uniref:MFS toxin efflux pump n=1 Tax=Aspergillus sclerotialis TaxID=2070753 RepID=A0A3A2ZKG2_9EURO|nr:MFS toxin efflux pump [Aspergillus sclerotialis]
MNDKLSGHDMDLSSSGSSEEVKKEQDPPKHPPVETAKREDGTEYPTGIKLGLIVLALCLNNSIIATAIPKITEQFHSLDDVGWYGSAYLLTMSSLQLLFGKLYSFFSIKWVYLTVILIFELGSLICGVAKNSLTLIIGRAIAGVGSAAIFSGALIILAYSVPLERRPMFSGFIGSMYGIASVAGPLLGGVFTDKATWRSACFFINLPIGGVTLLVIAIFFPDPHRQLKVQTWTQRFKELDPIGTVIFTPAVICLLLALQWGGTAYPWNSWRVILLFVIFGLLILLFLFVQYKLGSSAHFCLGAAFLCSIYYLPIWFQAVKGASAVSSGIMNLPMLISVVVMSVISGVAVTVIGYYTPFILLGTVCTTVGYGLMTTFHPDTPKSIWIGYQILAGVGVGSGMQQPLMAVQVVLDIADVPTGTAIIVFLQTLGGALFVSIGENVFSNNLVQYLHQYAPDLNPAVILGAGATNIKNAVGPAKLPAVLLAYNNSITQTFIVCTAMACASIIGGLIVEWKSVKGKNIEMGGA